MSITESIPAKLADAIPDRAALEECTITTYGELSDTHTVDIPNFCDRIQGHAPVIIAPGWIADDGGREAFCLGADSGDEAAHQYAQDGDWGESTETVWVDVDAWQGACTIDSDGDVVELQIDRECHTITIEPTEPDCDSDDGHDWRSPHSVLGGLEENPGVQAHGGSAVVTEVCAHCGVYRIDDGWAQNPSTGEQGLDSIECRDADEESLRWVWSRAAGEVSEGA